jgi:hypothetical protein
MRPIRPVLFATMVAAMIATAGCSGSHPPSEAGGAASPADGGSVIGELPAGEPPSDCPATPGISLTDGWETTTEEQDFQVSHQCTWTAGEEGGDLVATLMAVVVPRPSGMEDAAVKAFRAAPCEGDACVGAATNIEVGAYARGIRPSDATAALFSDNPGTMDAHGRHYEWADAAAWVVTEENMCLADLGVGMVSYDRAIVDGLLEELRANATALCGATS